MNEELNIKKIKKIKKILKQTKEFEKMKITIMYNYVYDILKYITNKTHN